MAVMVAGMEELLEHLCDQLQPADKENEIAHRNLENKTQRKKEKLKFEIEGKTVYAHPIVLNSVSDGVGVFMQSGEQMSIDFLGNLYHNNNLCASNRSNDNMEEDIPTAFLFQISGSSYRNWQSIIGVSNTSDSLYLFEYNSQLFLSIGKQSNKNNQVKISIVKDNLPIKQFSYIIQNHFATNGSISEFDQQITFHVEIPGFYILQIETHPFVNDNNGNISKNIEDDINAVEKSHFNNKSFSRFVIPNEISERTVRSNAYSSAIKQSLDFPCDIEYFNNNQYVENVEKSANLYYFKQKLFASLLISVSSFDQEILFLKSIHQLWISYFDMLHFFSCSKIQKFISKGREILYPILPRFFLIDRFSPVNILKILFSDKKKSPTHSKHKIHHISKELSSLIAYIDSPVNDRLLCEVKEFSKLLLQRYLETLKNIILLLSDPILLINNDLIQQFKVNQIPSIYYGIRFSPHFLSSSYSQLSPTLISEGYKNYSFLENGVKYRKNPPFYGIEIMTNYLSDLLSISSFSSSSELIKVINKEGKQFIFSATYTGDQVITLSKLLSQTPDYIYLIDNADFSAMIVFSILIQIAEGNLENFLVYPQRNIHEEVEKICFVRYENGLAFISDEDINYQSDILRDQIENSESSCKMKNILYFFPQMKEKVNEEFRFKFCSYSAEIILIRWLSLLHQFNRQMNVSLTSSFFTEFELKEFDQTKGLNVLIKLLPKNISQSTICSMMHKFKQIQQIFLESSSDLTHWKLLQMIEPITAFVYHEISIDIQTKQSNDLYSLPYLQFCYGQLVERVPKLIFKERTSAIKDSFISLLNEIQYQNFEGVKGLQLCSFIHLAVEKIWSVDFTSPSSSKFESLLLFAVQMKADRLAQWIFDNSEFEMADHILFTLTIDDSDVPSIMTNDLLSFTDGLSDVEEEIQMIEDREIINHKVGDRFILMGATENKLLEFLLDIHFEDSFFISQFLITYPYFTSEEKIFNAIKVTLSCNNHWSNNNFLSLIITRVEVILKKWITNFPEAFCGNQRMLKNFQDILKLLPSNGALLQLYAQKIFGQYESKKALEMKSKILCHSLSNSQPLSLLNFSADEIAIHFTISDFSLFSKIEINELRSQKWIEKNGQFLAPNITRSISRFNEIGFWCATEILLKENVRDRSSVLKKIIHIAERCVYYNNYNTAMAIISSLNFSSVSRLSKTWKLLPENSSIVFEELSALFDSGANYKVYRSMLLSKMPPINPYIGIFLRDLTFLEVGNSNFLDEKELIINFDKYRMISNVLQDVKKYQQISYRLQSNPEIARLVDNLVYLDDERLYSISKSREPPSRNKLT